ncbi:competence damage-inducible protein A [Candidatus Geothermarchaeota archaeon ex4572_27]|nr:MAG: competence damage-inducible protein A [Candidatus Geothermarchaeota archaeon ex4572_27]
MLTAWILTIGNEILSGRVVNTNAAWLADRLTRLGIAVRRIVVVPDEEDVIAEAFREAISSADIVISTGGLGPTFDDVTNFAVAKAVGRRLVINEDAYREVKEKYDRAGLPLTEERVKMSKMPEGARSLPNPVGTAPGILMEIGDKVVACLPGVPKEMKAIFERHLMPLLAGRSGLAYSEGSIVVTGVPESSIAPVVKKLMQEFGNVYIKSHPRGEELGASTIEIHVSSVDRSREKALENIRTVIDRLRRELSRLGGEIKEA